MVKPKNKTKGPAKRKKKVWVDIIAPIEFRNVLLGQTTLKEDSSPIGRNIAVNLSNILNDPRKHNIKITLKISAVSDKKAQTEFYKYEISNSHIKRMVRKARSKVEDSFIIKTADNIKLRIKPFLITKNRTQKNVLSAIRKEAKNTITKYAEKNKLKDLISGILSGNLQKTVKENSKKYFPVTVSEIRVIKKIIK